MKEVRGMGFDWSEQRDDGVSVELVLLAHGAAFNILAHKVCKAQPPEFSSNELASLEVTEVSDSHVVMTVDENGVTEGILWGNIDTSFVS